MNRNHVHRGINRLQQSFKQQDNMQNQLPYPQGPIRRHDHGVPNARLHRGRRSTGLYTIRRHLPSHRSRRQQPKASTNKRRYVHLTQNRLPNTSNLYHHIYYQNGTTRRASRRSPHHAKDLRPSTPHHKPRQSNRRITHQTLSRRQQRRRGQGGQRRRQPNTRN